MAPRGSSTGSRPHWLPEHRERLGTTAPGPARLVHLHPLGDDGGMSEVRAGMLLVATPALLDPNFADTVVLLLDVDENGALGVVINRPSPIRVADVLDGW